MTLPLGIQGLSVLDLGSGAGYDCFIAAQMVGPSGSVTGGVSAFLFSLSFRSICSLYLSPTLNSVFSFSFGKCLICDPFPQDSP